MGQIFYGAGGNAKNNIEKWIGQGYVPDCLVDIDEEKWGSSWETSIGKVEILSFEEALQLFPNDEIKITLERQNLKAVTEYLLKRGIKRERISYFEPVEYRIGCECVGKHFLIYKNRIRTCSIPGYYHMSVECSNGGIRENYELYMEYVEKILSSMRNEELEGCKGCYMLRWDIHEVEPQLQQIEIASNKGKDFCNAKCFYCEQYPMPSKLEREQRKKEVIEEIQFFKKMYPQRDFFFEIEAGEIGVANYRGELLNFLIENNYGARIRTNASIYCDEISELLRKGKSELFVTLDSTQPKIYNKCKGLPSVDKVMDNLRKYAENGPVYLKWIALESVYSQFDDIKGIIDFAREIHTPTVFISADTNNILRPLSSGLMELVKKFITYAGEQGVKTFIMYQQFNAESADIIKEFVGDKLD